MITEKFVFLPCKSGNSSVGRAAASQAAGRGFETRLPLKIGKNFRVLT